MNKPARKSASEVDRGLQARLRACVEMVGSGNELARRTGIPRSSIESYLAGKSELKVSRLVAIARAAGVTADWLAAGEGAPPGAAPAAAGPPLREALLRNVVAFVDDYVAGERDRGRRITPRGVAGRVLLLYRHASRPKEAGGAPCGEPADVSLAEMFGLARDYLDDDAEI